MSIILGGVNLVKAKTIILSLLAIVLIYLIVIGSIYGTEFYNEYILGNINKGITLSDLQNSPLNNYKLKDNKEIYANSNYDEVVPLYITVTYGENPLGGKLFSLTDINNLTRVEVENEPIVNVLVREGSPNGIIGKIGYDTTAPNGKMKIRGASIRNAAQKSFKINLYEGMGTFDGQTILNLNKCPYDETRILNKLLFDFLTKFDNITSMRTKFVHLFVMDKSKDKPDNSYQDYGLFTHIEQPSNDYLSIHGLDRNGILYKADSFEFYRYPDEIKSNDDPTFKLEDFEKRLKVFAGNDHRKIVAMVDDINKTEVNINESFNKYFDRDNYLTWMAFNLLLGNLDTTTQNYLLYSPLNSQKWYFIPWDLDGSLSNTTLFSSFSTNMPSSLKGLARYWSVSLHRRYFSYADNLKVLTAKVDELKKLFIDTDISALALKYNDVVHDIIDNSIDKSFMYVVNYNIRIEYMQEFNSIIESNYILYKNSLHNPMPCFLLSSDIENGKRVFKWSPSQDLDGDMVHYDFQLATDPYFESIIFEKNNCYSTDLIYEKSLSKGDYYWRVLIYDEKGNLQYPFNVYDLPNSKDEVYGLEHFYVY